MAAKRTPGLGLGATVGGPRQRQGGSVFSAALWPPPNQKHTEKEVLRTVVQLNQEVDL